MSDDSDPTTAETGDVTVWDVAVVGAGPAGSSAARVAATAGARTILLDRATMPRYKTCGGGLIGYSRTSLPPGFQIPVRERISTVRFTLNGRFPRTRTDARGDLLTLVNRSEFDQALADTAVAAGAHLQEGSAVTGIDETDGIVTLTLAGGATVQARAVVGADGSASRVGRYVGVRFDQVDLGLEAEVPVPPDVAARWANTVLVDWGPVPGSYGWVFPKGDTLTVGVIGARGTGEQLRRYYQELLERTGVAGIVPDHDSGHLTRCRAANSPLGRGRVLVAGDAAGLLEPWTREGISFALRSGALAGTAAAGLAAGRAAADVRESYRQSIIDGLGAEMQSGARKMRVFQRQAWAFQAAIYALPTAWRRFADFCRGPA